MMTLVYAQDEQGGIGYGNQLPWQLPNDLAFFKRTTMGHTMVMGRKTFESMGRRLLPGRKSCVLTRQARYGQDIDGLEVLSSLGEVVALAQEEEIMVIGGAEIFQLCLPHAQRIIRTLIQGDFQCDTFVDPIDQGQWLCVASQEGLVDEKNQHAHRFEWWERIKE